MRRFLICLALPALALAQTTHKRASHKPGASTKQAAAAKNAFTPDDLQWGPPPAFLQAGAELAVLEGNPNGVAGTYTVRLKMPENFKIAPHWHPKRENVTVLSGTLKVGMGDQFDESKMMSFPVGSFAYLDPSMHHYAMSSGATVIQIHGLAPLRLNYVNPDDDPRKKQ